MCMAQGDRDAKDKIDFNTMLPSMYLLYLGCKVLVCMYDQSYMRRFWPQLEAWLSFRQGSHAGLVDTPAEELRCKIICVRNEADMFATDLMKRWHKCDVEDAKNLLSNEWVAVFNPTDKLLQLQKIGHLNYMVRRVFADKQAASKRWSSSLKGLPLLVSPSLSRIPSLSRVPSWRLPSLARVPSATGTIELEDNALAKELSALLESAKVRDKLTEALAWFDDKVLDPQHALHFIRCNEIDAWCRCVIGSTQLSAACTRTKINLAMATFAYAPQ